MHAVPIRPGNGVATSPTPVVRIDTATVARRYVELAAALPGVELHYAVKANPAAPVLRTLNREGASWDVASAGEIDAVLAVGGDPDRMSFGNTVKRVADICYAHQLGVRRFSFDAAGELAKLVRFAPKATLMVRIATDGRGAGWALGGKFGCAEPVAADLLARAVAAGHPVGVTFHVGSQQRDPMAWDEPLAATARLRAGLHAGGTDLSVVNVGGGFPAAMLEPVPPIAQYGAAIRRALDEHLGADRPPVIAEPGRFLVADAGVLETEVLLVAERGQARWVYLDAGLFTGLVETIGETIRYRVDVLRDGEPLGGPDGEVVLAGPTCDSLDVLYAQHRYRLPLDLRPGDRMRWRSTGAYTAAYSTVGFNGFAPLSEVYS